jgi:hypothetical protein
MTMSKASWKKDKRYLKPTAPKVEVPPAPPPEAEPTEPVQDSHDRASLESDAPPPLKLEDTIFAKNVTFSLPTSLSLIADIVPDKGFVTIRKTDGTSEVRPAEYLDVLVASCFRALQGIDKADRDGVRIPEIERRRVLDLSNLAAKAKLRAKHMRESLSKHDHAGNQVDRVLTNYEWQHGKRPERGAYTADNMPEEANIAYLKTRFEYLDEYEISAILRADDVPWELRVHMLRYKNGQRAMEANKITAQDLVRLAQQQKMVPGLSQKPFSIG